MNNFEIETSTTVDKGLIRDNNEDNFFLNGIFLNENNRDKSDTFTSVRSSTAQLIGVFDGMGGEAMGEEASYIIAQTMSKAHKYVNSGETSHRKTILSVINDANTKICKKMIDSGERRIGATFAAITIDNNAVTAYNVGDSRIYMLRAGVLKQLSTDDTTAQRLLNMGMITEEEAKVHKDRHKLTQHLGIFRDEKIIEPHISEKIEIQKGDKFLLCSDGLTDMLEDDEIREILSKNESSSDLSKRLVQAALDNGGEDNVTVSVAVVGSEAKAPVVINKKLLAVFAAVLVCAVAVCAFLFSGEKSPQQQSENENSEEAVVSEINFMEGTPTRIALGKAGYFTAAFVGDKTEVTYRSSDPAIISVDSKTGEYNAVSVGTAKISALAGTASASLDVMVYIPVQKLTGLKKTISLKVGEKHTVSYNVEPSNAIKEVYFTSSDERVAAVTDKGIITGKKAGTAIVTITLGDFTETVSVDVKEEEKKKTEKETKKETVRETEKGKKAETETTDVTENKSENNQGGDAQKEKDDSQKTGNKEGNEGEVIRTSPKGETGSTTPPVDSAAGGNSVPENPDGI